MKVSRMLARLGRNPVIAAALFKAACAPFGSLKGISDPLWDLISRYAGGTEQERMALAGTILGLVFSYTGPEKASVEFASGFVGFYTPTSRTEIQVRFEKGTVPYLVDVRFHRPSESRAMEIREATSTLRGVTPSVEYDQNGIDPTPPGWVEIYEAA